MLYQLSYSRVCEIVTTSEGLRHHDAPARFQYIASASNRSQGLSHLPPERAEGFEPSP